MPFCMSVPKHHSCLTIFLFQKSHHIWEVLRCQAWGGIHDKTFQHSEFNKLKWKAQKPRSKYCKHRVAITKQQPFPTLSMFVLAILLQDCVDALFGGFGRIMFVVELLSDRIGCLTSVAVCDTTGAWQKNHGTGRPPMPRGSR